jgi:hypothetical protein
MPTTSRRRRRRTAAAVSYLFSIAAFSIFTAPLWSDTPPTIVTVDVGSGGDVGQYASHAIVNGNPAIAYYNAAEKRLQFIRASNANGTAWNAPVTVDVSGFVGPYSSLQIVNGNPAISYLDATAGYYGYGTLKYVRANDASGTSWGTPVSIDGSGNGEYSSLQVVNGRPAICYYGGYYSSTTKGLKYVRANDANGASWGTPVVTVGDTSAGGQSTSSLQIVNGNPAIAYYGGAGLSYVRATDADGASWGTPFDVDIHSGDYSYYPGIDPSMQVIDGRPAISYGEVNSRRLLYVRANDASGTSWGTPIFLTSAQGGGTNSSLQVVNGNPAVAFTYWDGGVNRNLKFVRATDIDGAAWSAALTLDSVGGNVGQYASLQIVNGQPAVAYYDTTNGNLKYVRASDASGSAWGGGAIIDDGGNTGDVGYYTSQTLVNGRPAVAYSDGRRGLKYVRALDAAGATWGTPVTIDSSSPYSEFGATLLVVNGNPAISYHDSNYGTLKYVRANDVDGTSWGTIRTLDTNGCYETSMKIVNGNPAVSYVDLTFGRLRFLRANDASGTSWPGATTIAGNSLYLVGTSLEVVNGNPAIAYVDATNYPTLLNVVRANDANGSSWGAPVTVDNQNPGNAAFAIVSGKPAISYVRSDTGKLTYVRATDINGATWGTPLEITGATGSDDRANTSLRVINGSPAIAYFTGNLFYVRATDSTGASWGTPLNVDNVGVTGQYACLLQITNNVSMSYREDGRGDLRYAILDLPRGTSVTSVVSNLNPSRFSQQVTFTATVTSGLGTPTGTVQFKDGGNNIGAAVTLDGSGVAAFATSLLTPGTHTITTNYSGDTLLLPSSGTLAGGQIVGCYDAPANLVAWYPAENNSNDIAGPTFEDGSISGGVTFVSGKVGQAFSFNGVNGKVTIPDSAAMHPSDFTYDAWIAVDPSTPAGDSYIICKGAVSQYYPLIYVQGNAGHHYWSMSITGMSSPLFGGNDSVTYGYQHIAVTRQGTVGKLYVDGVLKDTQTVSTGTGTGYPLAFGNISDFSANNNFHGLLDEVEFFNRALSDTEIANLYNAGTTGKCKLGLLQFSSATYNVGEGDGTATITVKRTDGGVGAASVHYATSDGSAVAGSDYTATSGDLSWGDGDTANKTFTIPITNDNVYEPNETINVTLSSAAGAALGPQSTATLTIADNDPAPTFSVDSVSHNEGNSGPTSYVFTVTKTGSTALSALVDFATVDGTATGADNDYQSSSGTLTFGPTDTTMQITVVVNGDTKFEAGETFTVHLSNAINATVATADGTGTIVNDDAAPTVQFSATNYNVNENAGTVTVTVTKTGSTSLNATVHYATSDGTTLGANATAPGDYTATSGDLTFLPNETSKTFTVPITNDTTFENTETFNVTLSSPSGATLGSPSSATVTIIDDDALPLVQFSAANYNVNEGDGTVTVTVTKTGNTAVPATVNYATSDGSATAGSDYTAASGTLTFLPNDTSKTFTVPITQDSLYEGNETVTVTLSTPAGASLGSPNPATVTIVDDDAAPVVQFNPATYAVNENVGNATVTVTKTGSTQLNAVVHYATSNGTATAPADYTATSGDLTFAPNETSKTIPVPIIDDTAHELDETFTVALSSPTSATLGSATTATVTINASDSAPIVTNTNDSGAGSLRQALSDALAGDTITFNIPGSGPYTITLTSGELAIAKNLTITGLGASQLTVSGNNASRVFNITAGTVGITDLTVKSGLSGGTVAAPTGLGGGFFIGSATVSLTNVVITNCNAGNGAGIWSTGGNITIASSSIKNNNAPAGVGAGFYCDGATYVLNNTDVGAIGAPNKAIGGAGFTLGSGSVTMTGGSLSSNQGTGIVGNGGTSVGGGIYAPAGTVALTGVNITLNSVTRAGGGQALGGGIYKNGGSTITISLCRFFGNTTNPAGGGEAINNSTSTAPFNISAVNNWWGCDGLPNTGSCQTVVVGGASTVTSNPRIDLVLTAAPTSVNAGGTSTLTADFSKNSAGTTINPTVMNGSTVTFSSDSLGSAAPTTAAIASLQATSTFTAGSTAGLSTQSAQVDNAPAATATVAIAPTVTSSTANLAANATSMTITGTGFSATPANNTVTFSGGATGTVTASSSTQLTVGSLTGLVAGNLTAVVTTNSVSSGAAAQVATVTPVVTVNTANLAANATSMIINGFGFSSTPANNTVAFSGGATGTVTASSSTQLTVGSLTGLVAGNLTAVVTSNSVSSGAAVQVATVTPVVTANNATILATASGLTINGFGFSSTPGNNTVAFGSGSGTVTASSLNSLTVTFTSPPSGGILTTVVTSNGVGSGSPVQVATVNEAPRISSANSATFTVGAAGSFNVATDRGFPTPALSKTGTLPGGVTFTDNGNGTATIAGTPAAGSGGSYSLTITASNGVSPNATQNFTLTVNEPPRISSANSATFTVGAAGSFNVTTDRGFPTPALSKTGTLPSGVTFTDNGNGTATITGTPAAGSGGSYSLTITASNSISPNATQNFTLTVKEPPRISSADSTTFTVGAAGSFNVTTDRGFPTPALSETGALPGGVTFTDNGNGTATIAGTPAGGSGGSYSLTITASNTVAPNANQTFTLTVNQAPAVTTQPSSATKCEGQSASFTAGASGYPAPTVQWQVSTNGGSSFSDLSGETNTTLNLGSVTLSQNGNLYRAVFTNTVTTATSNNATLTVNARPAAPTITPNPASVDPNSTGNQATGPAGAATYAWTINNGTITSATNIQTITYTAGPGGPVTLGLTISNASACTASTSLNVATNPVITSFAIVNGVPTLTFTTVAGRSYAVERKDDLRAATWTVVTNAGNISGTGNPVTAVDPDPGAGTLPRRFYHVVLLP